MSIEETEFIPLLLSSAWSPISFSKKLNTIENINKFEDDLADFITQSREDVKKHHNELFHEIRTLVNSQPPNVTGFYRMVGSLERMADFSREEKECTVSFFKECKGYHYLPLWLQGREFDT